MGDIDIGPRHYDRATSKYVKNEKNGVTVIMLSVTDQLIKNISLILSD